MLPFHLFESVEYVIWFRFSISLLEHFILNSLVGYCWLFVNRIVFWNSLEVLQWDLFSIFIIYLAHKNLIRFSIVGTSRIKPGTRVKPSTYHSFSKIKASMCNLTFWHDIRVPTNPTILFYKFQKQTISIDRVKNFGLKYFNILWFKWLFFSAFSFR